jgi:hypothetical protein
MEALNFPEYEFRILKGKDNKNYIYDLLRHKNILLTPEEWVRQNMMRYLTGEKDYPGSLISLEAGLKVNTLVKRYDALVYDRNGRPVLLIECKAPGVKIGQPVFDQIIAYNQTIRAAYLLVTNGKKHYCCKLNTKGDRFEFLPGIPAYDEL